MWRTCPPTCRRATGKSSGPDWPAARFLAPDAVAEGQDIPLFKTVGVDLFHQASMSVFNRLAMKGGNYTRGDFLDVLTAASALIDEGCADMFTDPLFWAKGREGGKAAGGNKSMSRKYAAALEEAVDRIDDGRGA